MSTSAAFTRQNGRRGPSKSHAGPFVLSGHRQPDAADNTKSRPHSRTSIVTGKDAPTAKVRDAQHEAAFAALAGVNSIPASSGNTTRHRLNRGGDRRLNRALHQATIVRMTHDPRTRAYVERRTAEGRTGREIRRCLKRYLARHLYRTLNTAHAPSAMP